MPLTYAEDRTGVLAANKITGEIHTITPENNRNFHFFIPTFAPFYELGFKLFQSINNTKLLLEPGVDYYLCYKYESASLSTAQNIFGGVAFTNLAASGTFEIEYQTVGGDWVLDAQKILEIVANEVYNPRGRTWDQVHGKPVSFGPTSHIHDAADFLTEQAVGEKLEEIAQAIIDNANRPLNTSPVTLASLGIPRIGNWGMASVNEAIEGVANDSIINPLTLNAVLSNLGLLQLSTDLASFKLHVQDKNNPHDTNKESIVLDKVENVGLAPEEKVIADTDDEGLISLTQLRKYVKMFGCCVADEDTPKYIAKGALLSTRCTSNYDRIGIFADGMGHTYEKIVETNSVECGYVVPIKNNYPPHGTVLQYYCLDFDRWKIVADGFGGSYHVFVEANSGNCGYAGGGSTTYPPAGTLLSAFCDKTVLVQTLANGAGGSYENRIAGHAQCAGQTQFPERGTLVTTFCENKNEIGKYTDGAGGYYNEVIVQNSTKCGYAGVTTPSPITNAPYGTPMGNACVGTTKVNKFADGNGGSYTEVVQYNSPSCGANPPPPPPPPPPPVTQPPTPPNLNFRMSASYVTPSMTSLQYFLNMSNGRPNTTYNFSLSGGFTFTGTISTDSAGNGVFSVNTNPTNPGDRLPDGTYNLTVTANGGGQSVTSNSAVVTFAGFNAPPPPPATTQPPQMSKTVSIYMISDSPQAGYRGEISITRRPDGIVFYNNAIQSGMLYGNFIGSTTFGISSNSTSLGALTVDQFNSIYRIDEYYNYNGTH